MQNLQQASASPTAQNLQKKQFITDQQFNSYMEKIAFLPQNPMQLFIVQKTSQELQYFTVVSTIENSKLWMILPLKKQEQIEKTLNNAKIQCAILSMHSSERIIKLHSSYFHNEKHYIMKEYTSQGNLYSFIQRYLKKIPQNICAYILKEILLGLLILHQIHQIHRDLISDNILIDKNGCIKIGGFESAVQLTKTNNTSKSVVGTPAWMAPELIKKLPYNEIVDIWSLGIIAVQLAQGEPPFFKFPPLKTMYFVSTKDAYRLNKLNHSPSFCDFVEKCLEKDPLKRYSSRQLLEHQFIKQIGQGQKQRIQFSEMISKGIQK